MTGLLVAGFLVPVIGIAATTTTNGIDLSQVVQCGGTGQHPCGYNDVVNMVNGVMTIFLYLIPSVGSVVLVWAGFMFMTSGDNADKRTKAKRALKNIGIGIAVMLGAWIGVYTFMTRLIPQTDNAFLGGQKVEDVIQLKK
jgi:hypothetical protein